MARISKVRTFVPVTGLPVVADSLWIYRSKIREVDLVPLEVLLLQGPHHKRHRHCLGRPLLSGL
jgi:hypothetical protein